VRSEYAVRISDSIRSTFTAEARPAAMASDFMTFVRICSPTSGRDRLRLSVSRQIPTCSAASVMFLALPPIMRSMVLVTFFDIGRRRDSADWFSILSMVTTLCRSAALATHCGARW
jgi:hypothetical protein